MASSGEELGWRRGPWTPEEDKLLNEHIILHGEGRWNYVPKCAGLNRSGKSCRLRWVNYLRPGLKKGQIDAQEEGILIELHALWGNKWSRIARYLPGRTDNEIKNYWRTHFKNKDTEKTETQRSQFMKQKYPRKVNDQVQLPDLSSASSSAAAPRITNDQVAGSIYSNHNASSSSSSSNTTYAAHLQASVNHMIEQQQEYYDTRFMYSDVQATTWAPDDNIGHEEGSLWSGLWNLELEAAAAAAADHHRQILQ